MNIGTVVLLGGHSRRMGQPKAFLPLGAENFLTHTLHELQGFSEILLSVNGSEENLPSDYPAVPDLFPDCGPMGGLHAALTACQSDALLAVSCDLPLFRAELAQRLCQAMTPDTDVVLPITEDGRWHPLCAVYRKEVAAHLATYLNRGDYKLRSALSALRICRFVISGSLADCLTNVNTPEELEMLLHK